MTVPSIIDAQALHRQRERHAASTAEDAFLLEEITRRVVDRLADIKRDFATALEFGCRHGVLGRALTARWPELQLVSLDPSPSLVTCAQGARVVGGLELPPFRDGVFDAVFSVLSLHAVNDLPGLLAQLRRTLRPDGLLLMALPGGDTLIELRRALLAAELAVTGGVSPRVLPFVDVRDLGSLLQRAGFALPVVDLDRITLTYADTFGLLAELRRAGEANTLQERRRTPLRRDVLGAMAAHYAREDSDARGRIKVTVDILFATAWSPDAGQQQPARRGSGTVSLAKAMGVDPAILAGDAPPKPRS